MNIATAGRPKLLPMPVDALSKVKTFRHEPKLDIDENTQ
tara:strand:- start:816 stop:932 length:117 start_codon:yes stop_codon:yes gene_type:complete